MYKRQLLKENVWIANDAKVAPTASISGPCIIDHGAEIRHCAFIRGSAIVGKNSVVGNSCELKNCVLFDGVQVPHFNYVGDSVLGYKSHMGAGAVTSNVKSDKTLVTVKDGDEKIPTGRKKFGAVLGDLVEVGCNSVLCPGSIIGRESTVYPTSLVRGAVPERSIFKKGGVVVTSTQKIEPMPVIMGAKEYPEHIVEKIEAAGVKLMHADALSLAEECGSSKASNVVLIGMFAKHSDIPKEVFLKAVEECVPEKFRALNLDAFERGYALD